MQRATITVAASRPDPTPDAPLNVPVEFASALVAGGDVGYTRHDAGNSRAFEQVLGALEGGHAVLFASGMAAITAGTGRAGARVGGGPRCSTPGPGRSSTLGRISGRWCANRTPGSTRTPTCAGSSPRRTLICGSSTSLLRVHVIPRPSSTARSRPYRTTTSGSRRRGCGPLGVQSTSRATRSDPRRCGVPRSRTRGATARPPGVDRRHRRAHGGVAGAAGMRTLDVRFRRAADNARVLAERLSGHAGVQTVIWPGLANHPDHAVATRQMDVIGPMLSVIPTGGESAAQAISESTRLWTHATSLGGVESTLERRRRHRFESPLVDPGRCCGCRSASRTSRTCGQTCGKPWKRPGVLARSCRSRACRAPAQALDLCTQVGQTHRSWSCMPADLQRRYRSPTYVPNSPCGQRPDPPTPRRRRWTYVRTLDKRTAVGVARPADGQRPYRSPTYVPNSHPLRASAAPDCPH